MPTGQRAWKNLDIKFMQKAFFQQYSLSGRIVCSCQNTQYNVLDLSVIFMICHTYDNNSYVD